ncbi:hypothetical protein [Bdellovibrio bacteriovorus]|uniref:hypothetical protein n=1 Tax=Bdellovibrio bacteriovorus TaxID=959 RepID=UPI0035A6AD25
MELLRQLVVFNIFFLVFSSYALAEWSSRNRLEVGMTDNALRTDSEKEGDFFFLAGTSNKFYSVPGHILGLRLQYQDYNKTDTNDMLSFGVSDELDCFGYRTCEFELKGQEYVHGEPATTDSSFNNYAFAAAVTQSKDLRQSLTLDLSAGYEARSFSSLSRFDNSIFGSATLGYDLTSQVYMEGYGEAGVILSSASEYSAFYIDMSILTDYTLNRYWNISAELGLKQTSFLSRDLTTETQVTRKNGKVVSQVDTSKETYSALYLSAEAMRHFTASSSGSFVLRSYQQRSRSGYQDYKENEILAKWLITF